jgi:hypothetical protein
MFRFDDGLRIYLHREPIDFRCGLNTLGMRLTSAVLRAAVNGGNLVPIKCFDGNQSGRDCG